MQTSGNLALSRPLETVVIELFQFEVTDYSDYRYVFHWLENWLSTD